MYEQTHPPVINGTLYLQRHWRIVCSMDTFYHLVLFFTIYAFFGWLWELVFIGITQHRLHLHGFLRVPILPIYGFSAVIILLFVQPYVTNPFAVFVAGGFIVSLIELLTGLVLDKLFHIRLWDYRGMALNIGGYTDFYTSLGFGVMVLFLVYVVQPWVASGVNSLPHAALAWLSWIILAVIAVDFANSLSAIVRTRIESGRLKTPSLDAVQKRLVREVKKSRGALRSALARLEERNLAWLRRAFPDAEITERKK